MTITLPPGVTSATAHPVMRPLAVAALVNTLGNGLFMTVSALLFTRVVGLSTAQVGVALAIGGVFGIVAGVPMGRLADRFGSRPVAVTLLAAEAVLILGYTQVRSFAAALPLICVVTFLDRGATSVRNALVAQALPAAERVRGRAFLRVVSNVGIGVGAALAALALVADTPAAYRVVVVADAATFLLAALVLLRVPAPRPDPAEAGGRPRGRALTDAPYLLVTALVGVMAFQQGLIEIGIPLWVTHHTHAPRPLVAVVLILNTALVVLFQVRLSRGTEDPVLAARACVRAGAFMAASCVLLALADGPGALAATALVLVAVVAATVGEMLSAAGGWGLGYELADQRAQGVYQGVFNSGFSAGLLLGPLVVTQTGLRSGTAGWLALGAVFLLAGLAFVPATRWALATRTAAGQDRV